VMLEVVGLVTRTSEGKTAVIAIMIVVIATGTMLVAFSSDCNGRSSRKSNICSRCI
jgi:hypothetical protein